MNVDIIKLTSCTSHTESTTRHGYMRWCKIRLVALLGFHGQGRREDWGGPGQIQKVGPHKVDCVRGSGGTFSGNFEILHALKCVLGAPEALFRACTQYIYTCKLPSSISSFRLKNTTYGAARLRLAISDRKIQCTGPS